MIDSLNIKCSIIPVSMERIESQNLDMLFDFCVNKNEVFFYFNKAIYGKNQTEMNSLADIASSVISKMVELGFLFNNILVRTNGIISVGAVLNKDKSEIKNIAVNMPETFFSKEEVDGFLNYFHTTLIGD